MTAALREESQRDRVPRPPKKSSDEICRDMGYIDLKDFLAKYYTQNTRLAFGDGETPASTFQTQLFQPGDLIDPDEFLVHAFPEFPPSALKEASLHGTRAVGLGGYSIEKYIADYERTYRHHYAMQDDWRALVADPDTKQYLVYEPSFFKAASLDFIDMEAVMVAVACEGDWWAEWPRNWAKPDDRLSNFIIDWRIALGTFSPDVDGRVRAAVWRDNWREVREALVRMNAKDYPTSVELRRRKGIWVSYQDCTPDEHVEAATANLCKQLIKERGLKRRERENDEELLRRVARDLWLLAGGRWEGGRLTCGGAWRAYIVEKSGVHRGDTEPFQLKFP